MTSKFEQNQTVKIIGNVTGHQFKIGDKVKIIKLVSGVKDLYVCCHVDNEKNVWAVKGEDLGENV